jgi:hypothetical protein
MHGITSMKKHIDNEHEAIVAKYVLHCKSEDEASGLGYEKSKKHKQISLFAITNFFIMFDLTKKNIWVRFHDLFHVFSPHGV